MSITEALTTPPAGTTIREDGDTESKLDTDTGGSVTMYSLGQVEAEDVLKGAGLDESRWTVKKIDTGPWDGYCKVKKAGGVEEVAFTRMWRTMISVVPSAPAWQLRGLDLIHQRLEKLAPDFEGLDAGRPRVLRARSTVAIPSLFDTHFGQYAWAGETGESNDLEIISERVKSVIDRIEERMRGEGCSYWVWPVGQDWLHIDNPKNETLRGTGQDVDTRYAKVFAEAFDALRYGVTRLATIAPGQVLYSAGNHDRTSSYHLVRELAAWFRNLEHVDFDYSWMKRKYLLWEKNLLGFAHGDTEKPDRLVMEMPTLNPLDWAASEYRAIFMGHYHHKKRRPPLEIEDRQGVVLHQVASLSGRDAYHYENGYHSQRAGELFVLSADATEQANYTLAA